MLNVLRRSLQKREVLRTTSDCITSHYCIASLRCVALLHFVRILSYSRGGLFLLAADATDGMGQLLLLFLLFTISTIPFWARAPSPVTTRRQKLSLILLYSRFEHAKKSSAIIGFIGAGDCGEPGSRRPWVDGSGAFMVSRNTLAYNIGLPRWVSRERCDLDGGLSDSSFVPILESIETLRPLHVLFCLLCIPCFSTQGMHMSLVASRGLLIRLSQVLSLSVIGDMTPRRSLGLASGREISGI